MKQGGVRERQGRRTRDTGDRKERRLTLGAEPPGLRHGCAIRSLCVGLRVLVVDAKVSESHTCGLNSFCQRDLEGEVSSSCTWVGDYKNEREKQRNK